MNEQTKKEQRRAYDRKWKRQERAKKPEIVRARQRKQYRKMRRNPEWVEYRKSYMRVYLKKWRKNNERQRQKHNAYQKERQKRLGKELYRRRRTRPYEKLASTIRSRIYDQLKHGYGSPRTEELLGCTFKELKVYLEKQFKEGMNWDNYGFYGWHADHIKPLSSFDLTNLEEQKKAFRYTNLQPLWMKENLHKHSKIS